MALSKEFYLDEIRSKYPNSYNESLKDLPVKDLEDMLDFLDQALDKADGGSIGIEVLFRDKKANGGRVPMVSGGVLKGLMSLFKGGDKAADLAKQEEIFRTGPITTKFLEDVDNKVIDKFIRTRDTKGPGSYGMYDNFDDMPAGLKAAELISRIKKPGGGIDYERAEIFIGKKLKGDETIDELIDMVISEPIGSGKSANLEELMADGGRVGLFMGGPALEGQALQIYNSMNAYGFTDQEIADALSARGLYTPAGSGSTTTAPEGIIGAQLNQGGGGDDNKTGFGKFGNLDPTTEKTFVKDVYTIDKNMYPGAPMTGSFKPTEVTGYLNVNTGNYQTLEGKNINHAGLNIKPGIVAVAEALGLGPIDETQFTGLPYKEGQIAGTFTGKKLSDFNPMNLFKRQQTTIGIQNAATAEAIRKAEAAERAKIENERRSQIEAQLQAASEAGGGYQPTTQKQNVSRTASRRTDKEIGQGGVYGLADGGLATMFTRRR